MSDTIPSEVIATYTDGGVTGEWADRFAVIAVEMATRQSRQPRPRTPQEATALLDAVAARLGDRSITTTRDVLYVSRGAENFGPGSGVSEGFGCSGRGFGWVTTGCHGGGECGGGGIDSRLGISSGQMSSTAQGAWSRTKRVWRPRLLGPRRRRSPSRRIRAARRPRRRRLLRVPAVRFTGRGGRGGPGVRTRRPVVPA